MTRRAGACGAVLLLAIACGTGAATARPRLERSQPLSAVARSVIKKEMGRHGKDLEALVSAVVALDHQAAATIARNIADAPRIARPGKDLGSANAQFPEAFFVFQDTLRDEAGRLAAAARSADDDAMSASFVRVMSTCVGCHATYLKMPAEK